MAKLGVLNVKDTYAAPSELDIPDPEPNLEKEIPMATFIQIVNLLKLANKELKYPKVRLQLEDGTPLHLSLAGSNSRWPGSVNVTDGGPYGNNKWFGRIDLHGVFQKSVIVDAKMNQQICKLLYEFANDPVETARVYGKETSNCCFCGLQLTDERSVTAGYGPICADKWGLPWGSVDKEISETVAEFVKPQQEEKSSTIFDNYIILVNKQGEVDITYWSEYDAYVSFLKNEKLEPGDSVTIMRKK